MTTSSPITYRKTQDGQWVAFGPASKIAAGRTIAIAKRDGTTKQEYIERVGKPFAVDGVPCVYGYIAQRSNSSPAPASRHTATYRNGGRCKEPGCNGIATDRGYCKSCAFDEFDD